VVARRKNLITKMTFKYHRRSIRLKDYDYSQVGAYFITICTRNKKLYFERYSRLRNIVEKQWCNIPYRFKNVELDEFVVMPNHIHGIVVISFDKYVGATLEVAQKHRAGARPAPTGGIYDHRAGARPAPTIGKIVGAYKSLCVHHWLAYLKNNNSVAAAKFWQRNYYEHIIRNRKELYRIRKYIADNPPRWMYDRENPNSKPDEEEKRFWKNFM